jgi:hypothetical protein
MTKIELLKMTDDQLDATVKIQGTKYDRKRRISETTLKKIHKLAKKNYTYLQIAKELDLYPQSVRYHIDPIWKAYYNANRDGKHTGKDKITIKDRVAYKRSLVAAGKICA